MSVAIYSPVELDCRVGYRLLAITAGGHCERTESAKVGGKATLADAVYVLQAFQKKTQVTSKRDIDIAKLRLEKAA